MSRSNSERSILWRFHKHNACIVKTFHTLCVHKHVTVCACEHVCTNIWMSMCMNARECAIACICVCVCFRVCVCADLCVCRFAWMSLHACVCVWMCNNECTCLCVRARVSAHACISVSAWCAFMSDSAWMWLHEYVSEWAFMHKHVYVHAQACVCVCTHGLVWLRAVEHTFVFARCVCILACVCIRAGVYICAVVCTHECVWAREVVCVHECSCACLCSSFLYVRGNASKLKKNGTVVF